MLTQYYDIDMVPGGVPLTINVTQYDVGLLTMVFTPYASVGTLDLSALASAQIQATKPDGLAVVNTCTVANGVITYVLQDQIAMAAGRAWAKLVLLDASENVIASKGIVFVVDRAGVDDDASLSESDLSGVQSVIQASENFNAVLIAKDVSGNPITITDGAGGTPVDSLVLNLEPHQAGSGDPSPSNVRAISGYTDIYVHRAAKNLLTYPYSDTTKTVNGITFTDNGDGSVTVNGTSTGSAYYYLCRVADSTIDNPKDSWMYRNGVQYTISGGTSDVYFRVYCQTSASATNVILATDTGSNATFTIPDDIVKYNLCLYVASGKTVDNVTIYPMVVSADETDLTWETYSGTTLSLTIPSSAGTVYGGTLDVTNGVLTVDRIKIAISDDTVSYNYLGFTSGTNANRIGMPIPNSILPSASYSSMPVECCNVGVSSTDINDASTFAVGACYLYKGANYVYFRYGVPTTYTTAADAYQYVKDLGCEFVVTLATPLTYTLTAQELTTLLGTNVIWMDADGSIDLTYRGNPAINITEVQNNLASLLSLIAPTEDDYTATTSYAIGDYVIVNYTLYKVTAAIASGETITPGTNCTATTIAAQIQALA